MSKQRNVLVTLKCSACYLNKNQTHAINILGYCPECYGTDELPDDYELCGVCDRDHEYDCGDKVIVLAHQVSDAYLKERDRRRDTGEIQEDEIE